MCANGQIYDNKVKKIDKHQYMNMKKTLITFLLLIAAITASAQDFSVFQGGAGSDIRPEGWLKEFLLRQKSGMTGHPEALSYPYNSCLWNGDRKSTRLNSSHRN